MTSKKIRSNTLPLLKYTRTRILQSRNGFYVELKPNGILQSTSDRKSPFIFLQFLTVGTNMVAIWGVDSRLYLAIDEDGTVFTTKAESKECVFKEYITKEFFSRFQTCHKNEDELAWNLCVDNNGKISAIPALQKQDRNLDFIVKLPEQQAIFCRPVFIASRSNKRSSTSSDATTSSAVTPVIEPSITQQDRRVPGTGTSTRDKTGRAVGHRDSQSSSDSQYSQSERSYPFTDSMEIMRFTSDSSLESFRGTEERDSKP